MEYNKVEVKTLEKLGKPNFKNIKKNDVISLVSNLNKMSPELAKEIIAKFPELASLLKNNCNVCIENISKFLESDDKSLAYYHKTCDKEFDSLNIDCIKEYDYEERVQVELSKELENPDLSFDQKLKIYEFKNQLHDKSCTIIENKRNQQKELRTEVCNKDYEKRMFDWKGIYALIIISLLISGTALAALGGDSNIS